MDVQDAYRILDLEVGATQSEVREQYKLLLQIWHPDKHTKSSEKLKHKATLKYVELDQAYKFIQKNPSKKKSTPPPKKKKTSSAKSKDLLNPFWIVEDKKDGSIGYKLRTNSLSRLLEKQGFSIYKEGGEDNTGGNESYIQDVNGIIQEWDLKEVERVVKRCLGDPDLWKNTDEDEEALKDEIKDGLTFFGDGTCNWKKMDLSLRRPFKSDTFFACQASTSSAKGHVKICSPRKKI